MATETTGLLAGTAKGNMFSTNNNMPQIIAHRGYKAAFPENSMAAFRGAVDAGAHAIETDLHLSSDGVVVLAHDASLKRTFKVNKKVSDCPWSFLSTLRTPNPPHEPLARLSDLLEYIARPGLDAIWLLLDIKLDDDPATLLAAIAATIASVPSPSRPWNERILLGCWNEEYVALSRSILPNFPISHIGFSRRYARRFLAQPDVSFNFSQLALVGPRGKRFVRAVREKGEGRRLFVWTVNDEFWMRWSIEEGVDGVVTDDPRLFAEVCRRWRDGERDGGMKARRWVQVVVAQVVMAVLTVLLWGKLNGRRSVEGKGRKVAVTAS